MNIPNFATLSEKRMTALLTPPTGRIRVVIDTDAHNEIDDQFTIAWSLLSQDRLEIEGVYAAPYSFHHHRAPLLAAYEKVEKGERADEAQVVYAGSYHEWAMALRAAGTDPYRLPFPLPDEGMELSYQEIVKVFQLLDEAPAGRVFRGSPGYLKDAPQPYQSDAAAHLIERAMSADSRPLYVVAIGAVTNIACALLMEPRILDRIVVVWTSAYPSTSRQSNRPSLNLIQDLPASRIIFDSGVPLVYLPGFYIGEQLKISLPDMERWVMPQGRIGAYLHHLFINNPIHKQRGISDHFGRTWIIWDLITVAWLLNQAWVPSRLVPSPVLDTDLVWQQATGRHLMREATGINRDAIFRDFLHRLEQAPR